MTDQNLEQPVFVVDDDSAVRDSIRFLLSSVGAPAITFESAQEFLDQYEGEPCVLVLDVRMPGMSGLELQEELQKRGFSRVAIIFISGHGDIPMAVEALKRGAEDFLPKPFRDQELLDRITAATTRNQEQHSEAVAIEEIQSRIDSLTPREREVMTMVADGKANKVVAIDLGISQRTVEIHRAHMMEKMGVRTLAHLVRMLDKASYFNP